MNTQPRILAQEVSYTYEEAETLTVEQIRGRRVTPEEIPAILDSGNRTLAGPTAPPGGLYLTRVWYEDERLNGPDGI